MSISSGGVQLGSANQRLLLQIGIAVHLVLSWRFALLRSWLATAWQLRGLDLPSRGNFYRFGPLQEGMAGSLGCWGVDQPI